MAHDVFISYSVKNKTTGDAVCAMLESEGIRCWIAPRDVTPGMEWSECIISAIEQAKIMVLIFSSDANTSPQIRREVERAVNHGVAILPVRIEDVVPSKALEYFIGNVHWLDALTPPVEAHLKSLGNTIRTLLKQMGARETQAPQQSTMPAGPAPFPPGPMPFPQAAGPGPATTTGPGFAPPFGMGAIPNASQTGGAPAFGQWNPAGPAVVPPKRPKVPVWAWGGAGLLVLITVILFIVVAHLSPHPAPVSEPSQNSSPTGGEVGSVTPAAQETNPASEAAPSFTSSEGRFAVQFPDATVKQSSQKVSLKGGGSTTLHQFWVEMANDNVSYMVMYNDYSSDYANADPQTVLDSTRDGAVNGKTLLTDATINLNGVPGREFTAKDGSWNYTVRQYLDGNRLYQLIVVSNPDHPATQTSDFFSSFKIQ